MAAKKRHSSEGIVAVDRLSDLPDEILGDILSFLPTKRAVQTSVFSRRWKRVFSSTTSLDFHGCRNAASFRNFVDRVLMMHKVCIKRFRLSFWCMYKDEFSCVNAWIASALSMGAQELDLRINFQMDDMTLYNLLSSSLVTVLKLSYDDGPIQPGCHVDPILLKVPTSVCLSSLNILKLGSIVFPDADSTSRFFLGCPSLRDLTLSQCVWMDGEVYNISFSTLRNLTINDWKHNIYGNTPMIVLDLPNGVYFVCIGLSPKLYQIKNPNVLSTAELRLSGYLTIPEHHEADQLLQELSEVKILHLLRGSLKFIEASELPTFINLSRLEVGTTCYVKGNGWLILQKLITHSPMLETLVFKEGLHIFHDELTEFLEERTAPFSMNPIVIQVDRFTGSKKQCRMVELFLTCDAFKVKHLIVNKATNK